MSEEELTLEDKAMLLASMDKRKRSDYDREIYQRLKAQNLISPEEIDGKIRRAIVRFVKEEWALLYGIGKDNGLDIDSIVGGALTDFLLIGYEVGRKLKRPLTAKPGAPR